MFYKNVTTKKRGQEKCLLVYIVFSKNLYIKKKKKNATFGFENIKSKGIEEKLLIQVGLHRFN